MINIRVMISILLYVLIPFVSCEYGVERTNYYRRMHQVDDLVSAKYLVDAAQTWADYLATTLNFHHSDFEYGENIAMIPVISGKSDDYYYNKSVDLYYAEINQYDFQNPGFTAGHFTQIVWKNTHRLGAAIGIGNNGYAYVVSMYDPPGNYGKQYKYNVFPISPLPKQQSQNKSMYNLIIKVMKKYKKFNCDSINQTLFNNNIYYDKCNNYLNSSTGLYYNISSVSVTEYDLRDVIQYSVINEMPGGGTITIYKNNIVLLRIESG